MRRIVESVLAVSLAFGIIAVSACSEDRGIIWQANAASPDGRYQAHAETIQQGGPGNADVSTEVRLGQGGTDKGVEIVVLSHNNVPQPVRDAVSMSWTGGTSLLVEYLPSSHVEFQAVKASGVTIEVRPRAR